MISSSFHMFECQIILGSFCDGTRPNKIKGRLYCSLMDEHAMCDVDDLLLQVLLGLAGLTSLLPSWTSNLFWIKYMKYMEVWISIKICFVGREIFSLASYFCLHPCCFGLGTSSRVLTTDAIPILQSRKRECLASWNDLGSYVKKLWFHFRN